MPTNRKAIPQTTARKAPRKAPRKVTTEPELKVYVNPVKYMRWIRQEW